MTADFTARITEILRNSRAVAPNCEEGLAGIVAQAAEEHYRPRIITEILTGDPEIGMPPLTEDKTAALLGIVPSKAEHIAGLTSMLKEFYWQGMTDAGSQALAMELYSRGARAPHGHQHPNVRAAVWSPGVGE